MTPSDAQRIERLLTDMDKVAFAHWNDCEGDIMREAIDLIARLRVDAERLAMRTTDADVIAWRERHDLVGNLSISEARCCIEDAQSINLAATAPVRADKEDGHERT